MTKPTLSIIGLGKLGSSMVAAYASKGYKIIGVDVNPEFVRLINEGKPPVQEPKLAEYLEEKKQRISATQDYREAILNSDITFIIVPTPSREDGEFSTEYAAEAGKEIGKALKDKTAYHLVVLTSTLTPGYTEKDLLPVLEEYSGKKCGVDFDLCYNPEFIALGNVIQGLLYPDFVLIGESGKKGGEILENFYNDICEKKPPIKRMSIVNAEITKISLNTYVTTKISYANMISELCEKIPGGNVDVVTDALGCDKRIGSKYLRGGLGYGGPCLLSSALIQTSQGLKRIDFIQIGDFVLSHDGKYHRVTRTFKRSFRGNLMKITPEGFPKSPIIATPEHPIWGAKRISNLKTRYRKVKTTGKTRLNYMVGHSEVRFLSASQFEAGDILALPSVNFKQQESFSLNLRTHHMSPVKAQTFFTPSLMKMSGFYLSEGSTWKEEMYAREIGGIIKSHFGVSTAIKERTETLLKTRTICSSLAEYFRNTFGLHAEEKRIPYEWLSLPKEYLIELMRGVWYGDGSSSDGVFTFSTTSRELFNFLKLAMLRLETPFSTKEYEPKIDKNGVCHQRAYHLRVCNPPYIRKMSELLPDLKISSFGDGKKTIWFEDGKMLYHIKKIESLPYKGLVFNLEVEGANSYMLESAVVHNCFPRDNRALVQTAKKFGVSLPLAEATDRINKNQVPRVVNLVLSALPKGGKVAILGLSYKPDTPVIEESQGVEIAAVLTGKGVQVAVYDPLALDNAKKVLGDKVFFCDSLKECLQKVDVVVVATTWKEFLDIEADWLKKPHGKIKIVDCWRFLDFDKYKGVADYLPLGINNL